MAKLKSFEKIIPDELVLATDHYFAHADLKQSRQALREFQEKQPAVAEFATSLGKELSEDGRNLLVYLSMVLWKIFDSAAKGAFPSLQMKELEKMFEEIENFFLQMKHVSEEEMLTRFQEKFPIQQPFVYQYLFQKLLKPDSTSAWPENELLVLFMALSSLLAVFSRKFEELPDSAGENLANRTEKDLE